MQRRDILRSATALTAALATGRALAQDFPSRPLRIVCPYPAGATTDAISRLMAQALQSATGKTVVVDNRGGAGGNIGTEFVARGEADGHTVLLAALGPMAANTALYARLNYDPAKDFVPLALAASVPLVMVATPAFPANNAREALALLKKSPDKYSYGSAGNGTPQHLAGELFKREAQVSMLHVPYRGSAPALTDLMGGTVALMFEATPAVLQNIAAGRLKALAVTSATRVAALPEVPTLKESGVNAEISGWYGFVAPAAVPAERRAWLSEQMTKALATPAVQKRLAELGSQPVDSAPQAFGRLMAAERTRWQALIRAAGIQVD